MVSNTNGSIATAPSDDDGAHSDATQPDATQPFDLIDPPDEPRQPSDPDGQMNGQDMPTADGQMASNTSEEVIPPTA